MYEPILAGDPDDECGLHSCGKLAAERRKVKGKGGGRCCHDVRRDLWTGPLLTATIYSLFNPNSPSQYP